MQTFICQITDNDFEKQTKEVVLSDGASKNKFLILPAQVPKIQSKTKINTIVKLKLSYSIEKDIYIVVQFFEVCYYDCPLIGNPV